MKLSKWFLLNSDGRHGYFTRINLRTNKKYIYHTDFIGNISELPQSHQENSGQDVNAFVTLDDSRLMHSTANSPSWLWKMLKVNFPKRSLHLYDGRALWQHWNLKKQNTGHISVWREICTDLPNLGEHRGLGLSIYFETFRRPHKVQMCRVVWHWTNKLPSVKGFSF